MENININSQSDNSIIETIGAYIKHHRLNENKTQTQLAKEAGIHRSTLVEFENGKRVNLITLIQLLRALNLLYVLKEFQVQLQLSPIQLAKLEGKKRKRAHKSKSVSKKNKSSW
ncbi:hypothetical protein BH09BAC5_BH09BAC5_12120 [soil metagenome]